MARSESETLTLDGHEVTISNPGKIFFADAGIKFHSGPQERSVPGPRDAVAL